MSEVFLDTVGLIATWDIRDQWHVAADAAYRRLLRQGRRLVTTPLVLWECGNAAARRPYRQRVNVVRRYLIQERLLMEPTAEEVECAWEAFDRGDVGEAGIVDPHSMGVVSFDPARPVRVAF